jgi:guanylate kinase
VEAGEFLEHAGVYGNRYGTLRSEVHRRLGAGLDVLLNIDVQGAASVRAQAARDPVIQRALVTVFVVTPTVAELERRLRSRGTDSEDVVQRRLAAARSEMDEARHFDYLLISGTVEEDRQRMEAIYLAEKLRFDRVPLPGC